MVLCVTIAGAVVPGFAEQSAGHEKTFPFSPGERLTFELRWAWIPAGQAVLEVLPIETVEGVESFHFAMMAKTYPLVDLFYEVRDQVDGYTDTKMTHSILYKKKQREGRTRRDVLVTFDWDKQEVQYADFGKKKNPISIPSGSFDPLSVFYAFRLHDLKENLGIETPVTDGKKAVLGKATVVRKEKIRLTSGTYDTYLVEPDLKHIGGVFEKSKDAKLRIWVTADDRRIPLLIESRVAIGTVVAELIGTCLGSGAE